MRMLRVYLNPAAGVMAGYADVPPANRMMAWLSAWTPPPLRVYSDPLYRGSRGTPVKAFEECHFMLQRHSLGPPSICETTFFLVDSEEAPRRRAILELAVVTCALFLGGCVVGLVWRQPSERLNQIAVERAPKPTHAASTRHPQPARLEAFETSSDLFSIRRATRLSLVSTSLSHRRGMPN